MRMIPPALNSLLAALCITTATHLANAQTSVPVNDVPRVFSYQGLLTNVDGSAVLDGEYRITLSLYADPTGTVNIWQDTYITPVTGGVFNLYVGSGNVSLPDPAVMSRPLWVGIQVGDSPPMYPLTPLSASPYALNVPDRAITTGKLADGSVTVEKVDMDYIAGVEINDRVIAGTGTLLKLKSSDDITLDYDETTNSITIATGNRTGSGNTGDPEKEGSVLDNTDGSENWKGRTNATNALTFVTPVGTYNTLAGGSLNSIGSESNYSAITGGESNVVDDEIDHGFIGGGEANQIGPAASLSTANWAAIAGGHGNSATADRTFVGGGYYNVVSKEDGTVGGGWQNTVSEEQGFIGGGSNNEVEGIASTVSGGYDNTASGDYATIGGGYLNTANDLYSTVGGGRQNDVAGIASGIASGRLNVIQASSNYSSIVGGTVNVIREDCEYTFIGAGATNEVRPGGDYDAIVGGRANVIDSMSIYSSIVGGELNTIKRDNTHGFIGGGQENSINGGFWSTIGGGYRNSIFNASAFIGGGHTNNVYSNFGVLGGGQNNSSGNVSSSNYTHTFVGGGFGNVASGSFSALAGGNSNVASGSYSVVGGGAGNTAQNGYSFIGGGYTNVTSDGYTAIAGGENNRASNDYAIVGGGRRNTASGQYSTVGGGDTNTASGFYSIVGGGNYNVASGQNSIVGGGQYNVASGSWSVIGGGYQNEATNILSTVAGGTANNAYGHGSTIGGGSGNNATANHGTISGGQSNEVQEYWATVGGGILNYSMDTATFVGGGQYNYADGPYSAIPGGDNLKTQSYAQTSVGFYNAPRGSLAAQPTTVARATNNDPVFMVGNGALDMGMPRPSNAFEVSYNGHSVVYGTNGPVNNPIRGATYTDNVIYAWGDIGIFGAINSDLGVTAVNHPAAGVYIITINVNDPVTGMPVPLGPNSPIAITATLVADPNEPFKCGDIRVSRMGVPGPNQFTIYTIGAPTGDHCEALNSAFMFHVTGRP